MMYAIVMTSGVIIHITSFIKIGSGIQKLIGGIHREYGDLITLVLFVFAK
jgi:hypothetical protein